jgi:hypothetical protein
VTLRLHFKVQRLVVWPSALAGAGQQLELMVEPYSRRHAGRALTVYTSASSPMSPR